MFDVITRAMCFVEIIILGFLLRRMNFFKEEDHVLLSKIMLKITLPASIVMSLSGREISTGMLGIILMGFGAGAFYMLLAYWVNRRASKEKRALEVLVTSGYNLGSFTMPITQSFLGGAGMVVAGLFDCGNAVICLGGAFSVASVIQTGDKFSASGILKKMASSVPFVTYIGMTILCMLHLRLPSPVVTFSELVGSANTFLAMLLIGVSFQVTLNKKVIRTMLRILAERYLAAAVFALVIWYVLPMPLIVRQSLVLMVFSPISAATVPFTEELKNDVALAGALNSVSIVISLVCLFGLLIVIL